MNCCIAKLADCNGITSKVETTDKGLTIKLSSDDPEKIEALKKLYESSRVLCGSDSCC